ncbi:hypothetical protein V1509DRAFT_617915 [Lipomyces kononenkoae]
MEPSQPPTLNPMSTEWHEDSLVVHTDGGIDSTYGIDGLSLGASKVSSLQHGEEEQVVFDTFFTGPQQYEYDGIDDIDRNMLEEVANNSPTNKKIILSAVGKANTAVQLDNDGNIDGAKMAYIEACNLLQIVMKRANKAEYSTNLRKIYEVYENRVSELDTAAVPASDGSASIPASLTHSVASSRAHLQSRHTSLSSELASRRSSLAYGAGQDVGSRSNKDSVPAFRDIFLSRQDAREHSGADDDVFAASARLRTRMNNSSSSVSSAGGAVSPLTTMADHGYPSTPSSPPPPVRFTNADILRTNKRDLRFYDSDSFFEPPSPTISIGEDQFEHVVEMSLQQVEDIVLPLDYLERRNNKNAHVMPKLGKPLATFVHSTKAESKVKSDISLSQVLQAFDVEIELAKAHFEHPPVRVIVLPDDAKQPFPPNPTDLDNTTPAASDNVVEESSAAPNALGLYYDKLVSQDLLTTNPIGAASGLQPAIDIRSETDENETVGAATIITESHHRRTPTLHSTASSETGSNSSSTRHRRVFSTVPSDMDESPIMQPLRRASSVNSSRKPPVFALTPAVSATPKSTRVTFLRSTSSPGSMKSNNSHNAALSLDPIATGTASSPSSSNSFTSEVSPASATSFAAQAASGSQFTSSTSFLPHNSNTSQTPQSTSTSSFTTHVLPSTPSTVPGPSLSTVTRADKIRSQETLPPRPADPVARPFWLMRNLHTALTGANGGPISDRLRLSPQIFFTAGVKLRSLDEKIAACEALNSALLHFEDVPSVQAINDLVRVMDRIETRLQPILVPEGSDYTHGFGAFGDDFFTPTTRKAPPVAVYSSPATSETSSERSVSVGSEQQSSKKLSNWKKIKSWTGSGSKDSVSRGSTTTSSKTQSEARAVRSLPYNAPQKDAPSKDSEEALRGPIKTYINVLIVLFFRAQVIEQIPVLLSADKLPAQTRTRIDLVVRRGSKFFAQVICKFVLDDIRELMDRYVKNSIRT